MQKDVNAKGRQCKRTARNDVSAVLVFRSEWILQPKWARRVKKSDYSPTPTRLRLLAYAYSPTPTRRRLLADAYSPT